MMSVAAASLDRRIVSSDGAVLDELIGGVLVLDEAATVVLANRAARELLGPVDPLGLTLTGIGRALAEHGALQPAHVEVLGSAHAVAGPTAISLEGGRQLSIRARPRASAGWLLQLDDAGAAVVAASVETTDSLTGLLDRESMTRQIEKTLERVVNTGETAALIRIDLTRFKSINDTLGYAIGDQLLRLVAKRLRRTTRPHDVIARLNGDEFAILQTEGEQPLAATVMAERLVDLVGRTYVTQGQTLHIGAHVGIALLPRDGEQASTALRNADIALSGAKRRDLKGGLLFDPEMERTVQARHWIEIGLRRALALKELELHYQPLMRLADNAIVGFEALLRWRHAEHGPVSPGLFVPVAEEIGLILPIGEWVLRTACVEAKAWPDELAVAVNISAVQFRDGRLAETVAEALRVSGLSPRRLQLEITESVLIDDTTTVLRSLHGLRDQGIRISMDDFGTGYSSLAYLMRFPFDNIKVDKSFVDDLGRTAASTTIVRTVAMLGRSLGMRITAEGVETADQLDEIRAAGCTEAQGYLVSRPLPAAAATEFIARHAARPAATVPPTEGASREVAA